MSSVPRKSDAVKGWQSSAKSTHWTAGGKKAPTGHSKKAPTRRSEKAPTYYSPVVVMGVVGVVSLRELLLSHGQAEWTKARTFGLLLLLSWICRQKTGPMRISSAMAEQYVSPIKRAKNPDTIQEPLAVLCHIGILDPGASAVFSHVHVAAEYRLADAYKGGIRKIVVAMPPLMRRKMEQAEERRQHRLNQHHPFREQLLVDLGKLGLAPESRAVIARMRTRNSALQNIIAAIDAGDHKVTVDTCGTIHTSISSLPRELKPYLTLPAGPTAFGAGAPAGDAHEPAVSCDVSHMHHCFLPRLLSDRIAHNGRCEPGRDLESLRAEHQRLVETLSGPDYYRSWCKDPSDDAERQGKKVLITALLNMPNEKCTANGFYRRMRDTFPNTYGIVEAIKRADHRNLSKQLQRFTSTAINGALREIQKEGIAAIPQTDAILCPAGCQSRVREVLGQWVFRESSGVRCKINGKLSDGKTENATRPPTPPRG